VSEDDEFNMKKKKGADFMGRKKVEDKMNEICHEIVRKNVKNKF
jgi:hypothetical protein